MAKSLPTRHEIPKDHTWKLEDMFSTQKEWDKQYNEVKIYIPKLETYKGTLGTSAEILYELLAMQNECFIKLGQLMTYANMRNDEDTTNSFYQGLKDKVSLLYTEVTSSLSFVVPELLDLSEVTINEFLSSYEPLTTYTHYLQDLNRMRPHVLSNEEETLLAQLSDVTGQARSTFGMFNNADLQFPSIKDENGEEVEVTHGRYIRFLESNDPRVRRDAFKAVYNTYEKFKNTLTSTLSGQVKQANFYAQAKNYQSAREAALKKHNIPEEVYDNLISTVHDNLHLLHRYIDLRKRLLGVDELHMYDLYTPLIKDVDMKIGYEEAKELVLKGMAPMGKEYQKRLEIIFNDRRIDVQESKGKRSGAYSTGAYGSKQYILMNWQDNINNTFTLAHELGHNVHRYYTQTNQPHVYGHYSTFVAEVASTANEALLSDYLFNKTDDKNEKLYLLNNDLEGIRGTIFRQTMFAEFEHLIHKKAQDGEALTPDLLKQIYFDLNKKYMGPSMIIDEEIQMEWARIPHFYMGYYVYQYATGYSAALSLANQILSEGEPAVDRYVDYLKAGSSDYPIEVLKKAGVDMTTPEPIINAMNVFERKLDQMEELLNR